MTATEESATPSTILDTISELLTVEARMGALGSRGAELRAKLTDRAREVMAVEGVAPTWRAKGLGTVSMSDPQPKVGVTNQDTFASWAAQRHPDQVTAQVLVPADKLEDVLDVLTAESAIHESPLFSVQPKVTLAVDPGWQKAFLDECAALDDQVFAPVSGEHVGGAVLHPAGAGRISVRLDSTAKARAAAEMTDPAAALVLAAPLGEMVTTARAAEIRTDAAEGVSA